MTLALSVVLAWVLVCIASVIAVVLQLVRHRARRIGLSLLCPIGAALTFGFVSAAMGLGERVWGVQSPGLWIALAAGAVGVPLQVVGWRAVLRPRIGPGQCVGCGYDLAGLARCPECGLDVAMKV
jgi:hypothetical protein